MKEKEAVNGSRESEVISVIFIVGKLVMWLKGWGQSVVSDITCVGFILAFIIPTET